jgi:hypothetical protein
MASSLLLARAPLMVEIVTEPELLRRSGMGSITGPVFLRGPTGAFPEIGWNDFPVVILGWWIQGLTEVVAGRQQSYQGLFMDGPFGFVVRRGAGASGRNRLGCGGSRDVGWDRRLADLLRSAVEAGRLVAAACRARGWSSDDLDNLERAISGGTA